MDRNYIKDNSNCLCFSGYDYYTEDDECNCKPNEENKTGERNNE